MCAKMYSPWLSHKCLNVIIVTLNPYWNIGCSWPSRGHINGKGMSCEMTMVTKGRPWIMPLKEILYNRVLSCSHSNMTQFSDAARPARSHMLVGIVIDRWSFIRWSWQRHTIHLARLQCLTWCYHNALSLAFVKAPPKHCLCKPGHRTWFTNFKHL